VIAMVCSMNFCQRKFVNSLVHLFKPGTSYIREMFRSDMTYT